jgi:hypothetical protein
MNMTDYLSSNYIRAEHLTTDVCIEAFIAAVRSREFEDGSVKPVIHIEDGRGVVLNQTRLKTLIGSFGPNSDNWIGKPIIISRGSTLYAGKTVPAVNIEPIVAPRVAAEPRKAIGSTDIRSGKGAWDDPPPPTHDDCPGPDDEIVFD